MCFIYHMCFLCFFLAPLTSLTPQPLCIFLLFWFVCFLFYLTIVLREKGCWFRWVGKYGEYLGGVGREETNNQSLLCEKKSILNKKKVVILDMKCYMSSFELHFLVTDNI